MTKEQKERRERIATAALQALLVSYATNTWTFDWTATNAVLAADALIAELDKTDAARTGGE